MFKPKVYVATKMTGRYMDELVSEARIITRMLQNYGFEVLHPVLTENVPNIHEILDQDRVETLETHWIRDKRDLKDCHLVLDDRSCNKSDGVGVELGITRFCYWKPVVRIFPNAGICISRLEYDHVFDNASEAVLYMAAMYGTKRQLLAWRIKMLMRSLPGWIGLQIKFLKDCIW